MTNPRSPVEFRLADRLADRPTGILPSVNSRARATLPPADMTLPRSGSRPKIPCAVTGIGRLTHLTAELLQDRAGIKLLIVPYTGGPAPPIAPVLNGPVRFIIERHSGSSAAVVHVAD